MKKNKIIIIVCVVLIVVVLYSIVSTNNFSNDKIPIKITEIARSLLLETFSNIEIKNTMVNPSKDYVNYVHDKLYKVEVTYVRDGKFKKIAFNIGVYKNNYIVPPELELLWLDEDAQVLFDKESEAGRSEAGTLIDSLKFYFG